MAADPVGLGRDRVEGGVADEGTAGARRAAVRLSIPAIASRRLRVVVADQPRRGVEDRLRRAVVLGEHDPRGPPGRAGEASSVAAARAAPAVDGLVVVADHGEVGRSPASSFSISSWAWFVSLELVPRARSGSGRAARADDGRPLAQEERVRWIWSPKSTSPPPRAASGAPRRTPPARVVTRPPSRSASSGRRREPGLGPTRGTVPGRRPRPSRGSRAWRRAAKGWRVGSAEGTEASRDRRKSRSRRKITCSAAESTRNCGSSPASSAFSRRIAVAEGVERGDRRLPRSPTG